ncbi:MAG TPA: OB-fold domain-containing protein [Acidimicrobiia bacterium]|nr:OB-fold domain-containing protein [Acidimicrobiia bacterium]
MRGILSWSAYLPYRRLDRSEIAPVAGQGGGKGTRTVAGYDEDSTTMAVEAARLALCTTGVTPALVLFGTTTPAYADKTNATAIHAALRLPPSTAAFDAGLSPRSALGALLLALGGDAPAIVASADERTGFAGSTEEAMQGDAGAAFVVGSETDGTVVAEFLGSASVTDEYIERWRAPGELRTKVWDERFSEVASLPLAVDGWNRALANAGLTAGDVARAAVAAPVQRVARAIGGKLDGVQVIDDLSSSVGIAGAAHPGLLLVALLEQAEPGQVLALVSAADGADVLLFRATEAIAAYRPARSLSTQLTAGGPVSYGKFLAWKGVLPVEPPRRAEPQRVSATAAARNETWKFGFVGSLERDTGVVHAPPSRVSRDGTHTDEMEPAPLSDKQATIATYTVDRLAYSPSPPIVFAVVDFDGGGRLPVELTDVDEAEVTIGMRVEMTFRRLFAADGIVNYFWKGKLVRDG